MGGKRWIFGAGGCFYAAAPHPSRLRRATFPRGGRLGCGGTWWVHPFRNVSPFLIRLACGEPPSPEGEGFGLRRATFPRGGRLGCGGTWWVHPFRNVSPFLIRLACGEPPSPEGEGFGAAELGGWSGEPTWAAGACPRPPHPSRLRRATFPRGGRLWGGGTWWVER